VKEKGKEREGRKSKGEEHGRENKSGEAFPEKFITILLVISVLCGCMYAVECRSLFLHRYSWRSSRLHSVSLHLSRISVSLFSSADYFLNGLHLKIWLLYSQSRSSNVTAIIGEVYDFIRCFGALEGRSGRIGCITCITEDFLRASKGHCSTRSP